jgi:hypothetical protein
MTDDGCARAFGAVIEFHGEHAVWFITSVPTPTEVVLSHGLRNERGFG